MTDIYLTNHTADVILVAALAVMAVTLIACLTIAGSIARHLLHTIRAIARPPLPATIPAGFPTEPQPGPATITRAEAAEWLGTTERTVRRRAAEWGLVEVPDGHGRETRVTTASVNARIRAVKGTP